MTKNMYLVRVWNHTEVKESSKCWKQEKVKGFKAEEGGQRRSGAVESAMTG